MRAGWNHALPLPYQRSEWLVQKQQKRANTFFFSSCGYRKASASGVEKTRQRRGCRKFLANERRERLARILLLRRHRASLYENVGQKRMTINGGGRNQWPGLVERKSSSQQHEIGPGRLFSSISSHQQRVHPSQVAASLARCRPRRRRTNAVSPTTKMESSDCPPPGSSF